MTVPASARDFTIIDVDTHLTEPRDLWVSRAPAKWRDRVPRVEIVDGVESWVMDGKVIAGMRAHSSVLPDLTKSVGLGAISNVYDDVHPASYSVADRISLMDAMGIHAQILYPNLLGFGGGLMASFEDELKTVSAQIYNDAMADFQRESGGRLFGMPILPWWNKAAMLREIERCAAMDLRGVNTNPEPHLAGLPDLAHDHWTPMFEMCSDFGLPINFHIGSSDDQRDWFGTAPWPSMKDDQKLAIGGVTVSMQNAKVLANLIMSGVAERFPRARFVSVESGAGWIPYLLEGLDYAALEMMPESARMFSMKPSEYFRRQFYACFWFESRFIADTIRQIGPDNVMFETDFPHPTCLYPDAAHYVQRALADVDPETRRKVTGGNASALYRIDLPKTGGHALAA